MTKHSPDAVVEHPNGPPDQRWRVKVNVPGYRTRLTLSRHESAVAAEVALALWRQEVYDEVVECRHELAWHTCATCLGINGPYGYQPSVQELRKLIGPGITPSSRPHHPRPAAGRNRYGGSEPDAAVAAGRLDEIRAQAIELVRRTTAEQGLPEKIEDPVVLDQVATLVTGKTARQRWEDPVDWDQPLMSEG